MAEKPILGLRIGEEVSSTYDRVERRELLRNPRGSIRNIQYRDTSIEGIWFMLQEHLGIELPFDLINAMSFDKPNFRWKHVYHPNAMAVFFIGAEVEERKSLKIDQAQGVIEVQSGLTEGDFGAVYAESLHLSGVVADSVGTKRVLAVSYPLGEKYLSQNTVVSLAEEDFPEFPLEDRYYAGDYMRSLMRLPRQQYDEQGVLTDSSTLITTPAMHDPLNQHLGISAYRRVRSPEEGMRINANAAFVRLGFNARTENGLNYVGFRQDWEVSYPATL